MAQTSWRKFWILWWCSFCIHSNTLVTFSLFISEKCFVWEWDSCKNKNKISESEQLQKDSSSGFWLKDHQRWSNGSTQQKTIRLAWKYGGSPILEFVWGLIHDQVQRKKEDWTNEEKLKVYPFRKYEFVNTSDCCKIKENSWSRCWILEFLYAILMEWKLTAKTWISLSWPMCIGKCNSVKKIKKLIEVEGTGLQKKTREVSRNSKTPLSLVLDTYFSLEIMKPGQDLESVLN